MNNKIIIRAFCWFKGSPISIMRQKGRIKKMGHDRASAEKELNKWISRVPTINGSKEAIVDDMVEMAQKWSFGYDEYFLFGFYEKALNERLSFVPDMLQRNIVRYFNKARNQKFFDDKGCCAKKFSSYYKRDWCVVYKPLFANKSSLITRIRNNYEFVGFLKKHSRFIVKPIASGCGNGVKIIDQASFRDNDDLFRDLIEEYLNDIRGGFIVEELIEQDQSMASFHPKSVNTIRITTVKYDNRVDCIHPFMRMGRGSKVVDNGGAGGLFADINPETGQLFACADEDGIFYTQHPDSGLDIIDFTVPRWKEAVSLAKELALVVKGNRYAGWDLALTNDGWVMVEGNSMGQFVGWQIPTQVGFKAELNGILKELKMRPLKY